MDPIRIVAGVDSPRRSSRRIRSGQVATEAMELDGQHPAGANAEEGKDGSSARARVNFRVVHPP